MPWWKTVETERYNIERYIFFGDITNSWKIFFSSVIAFIDFIDYVDFIVIPIDLLRDYESNNSLIVINSREVGYIGISDFLGITECSVYEVINQ